MVIYLNTMVIHLRKHGDFPELSEITSSLCGLLRIKRMMVEKYHHFSLPSFFFNPKHRPSLGTPMNPRASSCQWVRGVPEFLVGPILLVVVWTPLKKWVSWDDDIPFRIPNCFWKVIQNSKVPVTTKQQWRFSWEIYKLWISHEHVWILSARLWNKPRVLIL